MLPAFITALILGIGIYFTIRYYVLKTTVAETITEKDKVVFKIAVPRINEKGPDAAEQMYSSLHGILKSSKKSKAYFSFEIAARSNGIYFLAATTTRYSRFLKNQIFAQYPDAVIEEVQDYTPMFLKGVKPVECIELTLQESSYLPINTFANIAIDPLAAITSAVSKLERDEEIYIQMITRPIGNFWQKDGKKKVDARKSKKDAEGRSVQLESGESTELSEIERKNTKVGFQFIIRILGRADSKEKIIPHLEDVAASFRQYQTPHLNAISIKKQKVKLGQMIRMGLIGARVGERLNTVSRYVHRHLDEFESAVVNKEELASLYHLPNQSVETPNIVWSMSKKIEYPLELPNEQDGARILGLTDYRGQNKPFGLTPTDRRRHMYILGKTGTGKSTLMKNMIMSDIHEGKGVGVLDPHGDLIEDILRKLPENRIDDVILFDPADYEYPVGLNLLKLTNPAQRDVVADGIVEVFKRQFGHSWGPRLEYILLNAILTLLECEGASLIAIMRLLSDANYRKFMLKQVKDPILLGFWDKEFSSMAKDPKLLAAALAPIQNKIGRFVSSPMIRNMIVQVKSPIEISEVMNQGKILLVNLSQGRVGEENSALLGGLFVTRIFSSAMERVNIPKDERRDFYLYVDEFQNFANHSFVKILSEARKYGLSLIVTHQYIDQIEEDITNAIFGNVGTMTTFTVGPQDAEKLEREYKPYLSAEDMVNLQKYRFITKLLINGSQSHPFTAISLPDKFEERQEISDIAKEASREKYGVERTTIEDKIARWSAQIYNKDGNRVNMKALKDKKDATPEKKEQNNANPNKEANNSKNTNSNSNNQANSNTDSNTKPNTEIKENNNNNQPPRTENNENKERTATNNNEKRNSSKKRKNNSQRNRQNNRNQPKQKNPTTNTHQQTEERRTPPANPIIREA